MQVWIFFEAGAGGDGFANLLEQSTDIEPIDGERGYWRVHRIVNGKIKFYAPTPDLGQCFRMGLRPFRHHDNVLNQTYLDIVQSGSNCVVTSHDVTLGCLAASDSKEIFTREQIKVLVTGDPDSIRQQSALKNLLPYVAPLTQWKLDHELFDMVVNICDLQNDWYQTKSFCDNLGLRLDRQCFDQYQSLLAGETTHMANNYNVEIYQATVNQDKIDYALIDIWQPTDR